jgi:glycerol uptake operon antiterminator
MINLPEQALIPVLTTMKQIEKFLDTSLKVCILQDFHFGLLKDAVRILHEQDRIGLVHIEMIQGIANDEFGTQILTQQLKVDGIISSKPKIIEMAKKTHAIAIQRVFLIDSKSLERGLASVTESKPDVMEVMPALTFQMFALIKERIDIELWAGGLIRDEETVRIILASGAKRMTVSNLDLCVKMNKSLKSG